MINPKWAFRFLKVASEVASWSKDPSSKIGAVLVDNRNRIVSVGYNGFPDKIEDKPEWLEDRPTKYSMIIHAEMNAVLNAGRSVDGCRLYVTACPCSSCAKLVVQAGITEVHYYKETDPGLLERWADSFKETAAVFERAGVVVYEWPK